MNASKSLFVLRVTAVYLACTLIANLHAGIVKISALNLDALPNQNSFYKSGYLAALFVPTVGLLVIAWALIQNSQETRRTA